MLVRCAAEYLVAIEGDALSASAEGCFRRLQELWTKERSDERPLAGRILASLHNSGRLDAFAAARQAVHAGVNSHAAVQVLEQAIPFFDHASAENIFQFFTEDYGTNRKIFGGMVFPKLQPWLASHAPVAAETRQLHEHRPSEAGGGIYACALHALVAADFTAGLRLIMEAAASADVAIAGPALHVVGLLDYSGPDRSQALDNAIETCIRIVRSPQHPLLGAAVGVLGTLIGVAEGRVVPLLLQACAGGNVEALNSIAVILLRQGRPSWDKPWFWPLALELTKLGVEHRQVLSTVDVALSAWIKDAQRQSGAVEFLDRWIANQTRDGLKAAGPETVFDSTIYNLVQQPVVFSELITRWLVHGDRRYPQALHSIFRKLQGAGATHFSFSVGVLDTLSKDELLFLLRRTLGYLSDEDTLFSLVFSMLHTRDAEARSFGLVADVFQNRLAKDYPQHALDFLAAKSSAAEENEAVRRFCGELADAIKGTLTELDALPALKEFQPTSDKVHRFSKERRRQMNDAFQEASKHSIWKQIVTEIPLKGGLRTFHRQGDHYGQPMELKPMSHSVAIPLSEIFDPLGAAYERLAFRSMKKPSQ